MYVYIYIYIYLTKIYNKNRNPKSPQKPSKSWTLEWRGALSPWLCAGPGSRRADQGLQLAPKI